MLYADAEAERSELNWTVFRQDDLGNRYVVAAALSRLQAERLVSEFEARGHKQHYWCESKKS